MEAANKKEEHDNSSSTYIAGYKPEHITHHAWRTAENSAAYLLPTLQSMAQKTPNLKLLDCGAGPGTISASLAKYIPHGTLLATDISEEILHRAAAFAKSQKISNMTFQPASIYALPFPPNSFDIVHAQQVLCHLSNPLEALKEMLRVCREGGIVALRECDMRMWSFHPELPGLLDFHKILLATMDLAEGSNTMGPRLVNLALEAGVPRENVKASMGTWCYSTREEREIWGGVMRDRIKTGGMRQKILDAKLGWSEEQLDRMADAWDEWIEAEDGCFGCMHGEVLITK